MRGLKGALKGPAPGDQQGDIDALRLETRRTSCCALRPARSIERLRVETSKDIERLRSETKKDIENLQQETKKDIEAMRGTKKDIENLQQETKKGGHRKHRKPATGDQEGY